MDRDRASSEPSLTSIHNHHSHNVCHPQVFTHRQCVLDHEVCHPLLQQPDRLCEKLPVGEDVADLGAMVGAVALFLTSDSYDEVLIQTNLYANQTRAAQNDTSMWTPISKEEFMAFVGKKHCNGYCTTSKYK